MNSENTTFVGASISAVYRVLLGDAVVDDLEGSLGKSELKQFFHLHEQYDKLSQRYPKSEPIMLLDADSLPRFDSLLDYSRFLHRVSSKLAPMRDKPGPELIKLVQAMIKIVDANLQETTAAVIDPKRPMIGRSLPSVPMKMRAINALPYSYPSFDKTLDVVESFWNDKGYSTRLSTELNRVVAASLKKLSESMKHTEGATLDVGSLAVAAQVYLVEHNWIRFGLEDVAEASFALASNGYEHTVTVDGEILFSNQADVSYRFLGGNLEVVLRRCILTLAKDTLNGVVLAGRQPAVDVTIACASLLVQRYARNWLLNMHHAFQDSSVGEPSLKMAIQ